MQLWHETSGTSGDGETVLLIHAGICDARMWERQMETLGPAGRVVRCDLQGFGRTPAATEDYVDATDLVELIEGEGLDPVVLVGASMGGAVALDIALGRPDLAAGLVLVAASHPDQEWSAEMEAYGEREGELLEAGDIEAAVELNLRTWVDGPFRSARDVDPELRAFVGTMQRRAFELQLEYPDAEGQELTPDPGQRLGEIAVSTLILVGDLDVPEMAGSAPRLAADIKGATVATITGASHLPSLERPERFDELVLGFLASLED